MERITIDGRAYNVGDKYRSGHSCTDLEAKALNQLMRRRIQNVLAKNQDGLSPPSIQAMIDQLVDGWDFGESRWIEAEAMHLARDVVKAKIKEEGGRIGDYSDATITESARALLSVDGIGGELRSQARQRIEALKAREEEVVL